MKMPRPFAAKTAIVLSLAALAAAVFVGIFGPVVAYVLAMAAFVGGCYAAALTWAPEFFADPPK
jgi:multisubunit Na+/H+ antiporter MnhG subunit